MHSEEAVSEMMSCDYSDQVDDPIGNQVEVSDSYIKDVLNTDLMLGSLLSYEVETVIPCSYP